MSRSLALISLPLALSLVAVVGWNFWPGRSESRAGGVYGTAIGELQRDNGEVAATVNGQPISKAKLNAYRVFLSAGMRFGQTGPDYTMQQYLQMLIDNEIMYQEASRRGLVPSDAEVQVVASQTKAELLKVMQSDTETGTNLRGLFSEVKGTAYDIDVYDTNPVSLNNFRRSMAVSALRSQIIAGLSDADRMDQAKKDGAVQSFLAQAKARSRIEVAPGATD